MNGVLGLKPLKCYISRFIYPRDLKCPPIDAEYTILYNNFKGCKALSAIEKSYSQLKLLDQS